MNRQRGIKAVRDRIAADTSIGAGRLSLSVGQVPDFRNLAIDSSPQFYLNFAGSASQDDSGGSAIEYFLDITIVGNRNSETDDEVWIAADRIQGNASSSNGFTPTYGLHRHNLEVTSASDTVALTCLFVEESVVATDDPDNLVAHSMRFRVIVRSV